MVHKATWYGTIVAAKILKNTSDIALGDFRTEIEVLRKVRLLLGPDDAKYVGSTCRPDKNGMRQ